MHTASLVSIKETMTSLAVAQFFCLLQVIPDIQFSSDSFIARFDGFIASTSNFQNRKCFKRLIHNTIHKNSCFEINWARRFERNRPNMILHAMSAKWFRDHNCIIGGGWLNEKQHFTRILWFHQQIYFVSKELFKVTSGKTGDFDNDLL